MPRFTDYLRSLRKELDYMILGSHGDESVGELHSTKLTTEKELWEYFERTVYGMETGLYLYLAHPDIMLGGYPAFDNTAKEVSRALCREANHRKMPMEFNLLGIQKGHEENQLGYPCNAFWETAAEENITAVIGVDAHRPEMLKDFDFEGAEQFLRNLGIKVRRDPFSKN